MKPFKPAVAILAVAAIGILTGCSAPNKSPAVVDSVRASLNRAGYKDVSVSQDRDKGVVTLTGKVPADADKAQAEAIAKSIATNQVVADEIAVIPPGAESDAKKVNSELDKGIEHNVDAVLVTERLHDAVKYAVKNRVVTLTGNVDSEASRDRAQTVALAVPYVQQVVNELQVKGQKATSSN
jgi:hyperosmotically inducible protein